VVDTNCSPEGIEHVIPGNDDAMRAIHLYASSVADAVIEGQSSVPQMMATEDEFVELDEEGNPRRKAGARPSRAPARPAAVRNRKPAPRRPVASVAPGGEADAAAATADGAADAAGDVDGDEALDAAAPPASAPASAPARRRTPQGGAGGAGARRGPR
jgi:hypothetical protein